MFGHHISLLDTFLLIRIPGVRAVCMRSTGLPETHSPHVRAAVIASHGGPRLATEFRALTGRAFARLEPGQLRDEMRTRKAHP